MYPSEKHPLRHATPPSQPLLPQLTRCVLLPVLLLLGAFTSPCQARGGGGHGGGHSSSGGHSSGRSSSRSHSSYRAPGEHYTHGYTRRDGTYVSGHYQTNPDGDFYDNYSTKGNVNPHTGKEGTLVTPSGNERGEIDYRGTGDAGDGQTSNKQVYQDNKYQDNKSSEEATGTPPASHSFHLFGGLFGRRHHSNAASSSVSGSSATSSVSGEKENGPLAPAVAATPPPPRLPQISAFPQRVRIEISDGNSYFGNVTAFDGSHYTVDTKSGPMTVDQGNITTLEILNN